MSIFDKARRSYSNPGITRLINQSYDSCWSIEKDIDWNQEIIIPDGVSKDTYMDMVSQLYYTEVFIINIAAKLIEQIDDLQAKQYITTQLSDETRHALVYEKYLLKFGEILPINSYIENIFNFCLNFKGHYSALLLALNVVMEGEAVGQQKLRVRTLPCPLFKQINTYIIKDEARHATFGLLYMLDIVKTLSEDHKSEIKEFIRSIWSKWDEANENRYEDEETPVLQTTNEELSRRYSDMIKRVSQVGIQL